MSRSTSETGDDNVVSRADYEETPRLKALSAAVEAGDRWATVSGRAASLPFGLFAGFGLRY